MLRVTAKKEDGVEILELEGRLSGEWVAELERCWQQLSLRSGAAVQVHLKAVSYVDAAGKQLLAEMHRRGVEIKGCGCMAKAVVEEVIRDAGSQGSPLPIKKILAMILLGVCILSGV